MSGYFKAESVALVAEVDRLFVHVVAVHAIELILVVRRNVRIGWQKCKVAKNNNIAV